VPSILLDIGGEIMWIILDKNKKVIATINVMPSLVDLATREETTLDIGNAKVDIGETWEVE